MSKVICSVFPTQTCPVFYQLDIQLFLKGLALSYSLLRFMSFPIPGCLLLLLIGAYPSSQA